MSRTDYMEAGDQMDRLIAEKIFHCKLERGKYTDGRPTDIWWCACPDGIHNRVQHSSDGHALLKRYSADNAVAHEVWDKLGDCIVTRRDSEFYVYMTWREQAVGVDMANAQTFPLAICRAALSVCP